jgi:cell division protein FtsZ
MLEDEIKYSDYSNNDDDNANNETSDDSASTGQDLASNYELLNQKYKIKPPKIVVLGVGGGGCNAVNSIYNSGEIDESVVFIVANTDLQSLNISNVKNKILLGRQTTGGYGAGSDPDVGRVAAEESLGEIEQFLQGVSMIFITGGMGGGTGTGAIPVIAKKAKEMNILVATIVTKPFAREGALSLKKANEGIKKLKKYTDTLIIIPNQNLSKMANPKTTMQQSFAFVDRVLQLGVKSIVDLITQTGFINLDFADIRTIMKKKGRAVMGTGEASGPNRAVKAVEEAISNPLLDNISIRGAKGVILHITSSANLTYHEYDNATKRLNEEIDDIDNAMILHGNLFDPEMKDAVRVSIFATGIGSDDDDDEEEWDNGETKVKIKNEDINNKTATEPNNFVEKEYDYIENDITDKAPDENDFFDLGDTKKYEEIIKDNKSIGEYKKNNDYDKIVQKINSIAKAKESAVIDAKDSLSQKSGDNSFKKDAVDGKRGFFSSIFSSKNKSPEIKKQSELKQKNTERKDDLSIVEVENFDNIDIDVYEVPAYLRKKNE